MIPNGTYDRLEDFNVRRIYEKELGGAKAEASADDATAVQPTEPEPESEVAHGEKGKEKEEAEESAHPNEAHEGGGDQQPPQAEETPKE